ncbi:hypothetical protein M1349_02830 [Patescibacteria group bacterium]|nr:hypothetical protein [Patescibacteria group bacterium]
MKKKLSIRSVKATLFGTSFLLICYFAVVLIFYGPMVLVTQFLTYWYFLFILAISFGIHLGKELHPLL